MSQRTRIITVCDGCHKEVDEHELYETKVFGEVRQVRVDICEECWNQDKFICRQCCRVHDEAHLCEEHPSREME